MTYTLAIFAMGCFWCGEEVCSLVLVLLFSCFICSPVLFVLLIYRSYIAPQAMREDEDNPVLIPKLIPIVFTSRTGNGSSAWRHRSSLWLLWRNCSKSFLPASCQWWNRTCRSCPSKIRKLICKFWFIHDRLVSSTILFLSCFFFLQDPTIISYETLLYYFWRNIDPTDASGQFCWLSLPLNNQL